MSGRPIDSLLTATERLKKAMDEYECALEEMVNIEQALSSEDQTRPPTEREVLE